MPRTKAPPRSRASADPGSHAANDAAQHDSDDVVHILSDDDDEYDDFTPDAKRRKAKPASASFAVVHQEPANFLGGQTSEHLLLCTLPVQWAVEEHALPPLGLPQGDWLLLIPSSKLGQPQQAPLILNARSVGGASGGSGGVKKGKRTTASARLHACSLGSLAATLDVKAAAAVGWLVHSGLACLNLTAPSSWSAGAVASGAGEEHTSGLMPTGVQVWLHKGLFGLHAHSVDQGKLKQSPSHLAHILRSAQCICLPSAGATLSAGSSAISRNHSCSIWTSKPLIPTVYHRDVHNSQCASLTEQDMYAAAAPLPEEHCPSDHREFSAREESALSLCLRPTLRQYQRRSLRWMLHRERGTPKCDPYLSMAADAIDPTEGTVPLHPAWLQALSQDGQTFYASPFYGLASLQPVYAPTPAHGLRGGIYADEMGLGKTVVTLGLVLCTDKEQACRDAPSAHTSSPALVQERLEGFFQAASSSASASTSPSPTDSDVACICGATYSTRTPLVDPFRLAHMGAKQRTSLVQGEVADVLTWVQCAGCRRWQHALCGGLREHEAGGASFLCTECQACASGGFPVACHTSLVICPLPILKQWQAEIAKNAVLNGSNRTTSTAGSASDSPGLRIEYYSGVKATLAALRDQVSAANRLTSEVKTLEDKLGKVKHAYTAAVWSAMQSAARTAAHTAPAVPSFSNANAVESHKPYGPGDAQTTDGAAPSSGEASSVSGGAGVDKDEVDADMEDEEDAEEMSDDGFSLRTKKPRGSSTRGGFQRRPVNENSVSSPVIELSTSPPDVLLLRLHRAKQQLEYSECAAVKLAATLSPVYLSKADLVLSTYAALEADLHHADTVALPTLASAKVISELAAAGGHTGSEREQIFRSKLQMMLRGESGWQDMPLAAAASQTGVGQSVGKRKRAVIDDSDEEGAQPPTQSLPATSATSQKKNTRQLSALGVAVDPLSGAIVRKDSSFHGMFGLHGDLNVGSGGRKLRHGKKYRVVPSPLLGVHFHRIALDEAQMIDTPVTKCAQMANRLSGSFRWAVSGTPLARSLQDLHGLLLFLGVHPYDDKALFYKGLIHPAEQGDKVARGTLLKLAHDVIWRTHKADVQHELQLPPLTQETLTLHFSRIEEAYYRREFGRLLARIEPVLSVWRTEERKARKSRPSEPSASTWLLGDSALTKSENEKLLAPLLRLRQACVHPAIGAQGIGKGKDRSDVERKKGRGRNEVLSMATVLELMLARAKSEAEDRLRDVVASHNGLAGLAWLAEDYSSARTHYQAVLDLATAGLEASVKSAIRVDPMQRIHAMRNYASFIRAQPTSEAPLQGTMTATLHADMLDRQAGLLEEDVVRAAAGVVQSEFGKLSRDKVTLAMKLTHTSVSSQVVQATSGSSSMLAGQKQTVRLADPRAGNAVAATEVSQALGALCQSSSLLADCLNVLVFEGVKAVRSWGPDQSQSIVDAVRYLHGQSESVASKDLRAMAGTSAMSVLWQVDTVDAALMLGMAALGELCKARTVALQQAIQWMQPSASDLAVTSNCRMCRVDWGKTGDVCQHCSARKGLLAYRSILQTARQQTLDEEAIAKQGKKYSASGRLQRAKTKIVPGAQGDLRTLLTAEEEAAAVSEDPVGPMDGSFMTSTALVRMLRAVAKACKGMHVDLGSVLSKGLSKCSWTHTEGGQMWMYALQATAQGAEQGPFTIKYSESTHLSSSGAVGCPTVVVDVGAWIESAVTYLEDEQQALVDLHKVQADLLSSVDELAASLTRMVLAPSGRVLSDAEALYMTTAAELPSRQKTLRLQLTAFEGDLRKARSQLSYLLSIQAEEGRTATAEAQGSSLMAASTCAICREPVGATDGGKVCIISACAHRFCRVCLRAHVRSSTSRDEIYGRIPLKCPECRIKFEEQDIVEATTDAAGATSSQTARLKSPAKAREPIAAGIVSPGGRAGKLYESDDEDEAPNETGQQQDMNCLAHLVNNPSAFTAVKADAQTAVTGSFGVKVETLVLCLKALRVRCERQNPSSSSGGGSPVAGRSSKSIVFSQWDEAHAIVQAACDRNGVKVYRVTSARHVSEVKAAFAADESADALLLPLNVGAEGLNVQEANHVFFLEPCLQPALEAQAIGRVWRMGQSKPTYVHRLVIAGSIEETVLAMGRHRGRRLAAWAGGATDSERAGTGAGTATGRAHSRNSSTIDSNRHRVLEHLDGLVERSMTSNKAEPGVRAVAGRGDSAGITRKDILKLFEAEEAFQKALDAPLPASNASAASTRTAVAAGSATYGEDEDEEAHGDQDTAAAVEESLGGAPVVPKSDQTPADELSTMGDSARTAALNHSFWNERVVLSGVGSGHGHVIRLAALELLQQGHESFATPGTARFSVFGRSLPATLAATMLRLPRLLPLTEKATARTTMSSLKAAPPTLQEQVSQHIDELLAEL